MRYLTAILALLITAIGANAQQIRRPFPVATGVGRAINRVVGFPFRVGAAALGFHRNVNGVQPFRFRSGLNVNVNTVQPIQFQRIYRQPSLNIRVNAPQQFIAPQRIFAPHYTSRQSLQFRRGDYHGNNRQPILASVQSYHGYSANVGSVSQTQQIQADPQPVVTTTTTVQREVVQPQQIQQETVCPPTQQVILQPVVAQRLSSGQCGAVGAFRY